MSSALIWECVKNNSSFLRRSVNHTVFTSEPGNLTQVNSFKASGLANPRAIGIEQNGNKLKVVIKSAKKGKFTQGAMKKGARKSIVAIQKLTGRYRKDLSKPAVARVSAIYKAINKGNKKQ